MEGSRSLVRFSFAEQTSCSGWLVHKGIELLNAAGKKVARIRLDIDESKGIHWNTEDWQTSTTKTASCIRSTKGRPTASNAVLYNQYVRALYGVSGDTIWQRWKMGVGMCCWIA